MGRTSRGLASGLAAGDGTPGYRRRGGGLSCRLSGRILRHHEGWLCRRLLRWLSSGLGSGESRRMC